MIEQIDVFLSLIGAFIFAIIAATPGKKIGIRDEKLDTRSKFAYFFATYCFGFILALFGTFFWRDSGFAAGIIVIVLGTPIVTVLMAAYYLFLTADDTNKNSPSKDVKANNGGSEI